MSQTASHNSMPRPSRKSSKPFYCTCGELVVGKNKKGEMECLQCHKTYQKGEVCDHDTNDTSENGNPTKIIVDMTPPSTPESDRSSNSPIADLPPLEPKDLPPLEKLTSAQIKEILRQKQRKIDKQRLADTRPRKPTHHRSMSAGDTPEMKTPPPLERLRPPKQRSKSSPTPQPISFETGPDYSLFLEKHQDIREVKGSASEREVLFIKKLKLCRMVFDFSENEDRKFAQEKERKRAMLLELVDYITSKPWYTTAVVPEIIQTSAENLFRSLPYNPRHSGDFDDDDPRLDPSWPHLQLVYELLLRFVVSNDTNPKVLKGAVSEDFIVQFLELFESDDPRERGYVQTILHRIYGKCMPLRGFIRKAIADVFYRVIYVTNRHNGAGELLEILGSIINGFALPIKSEHKWYLRNVLIPLHKVESLQLFHKQLVYCVAQFVYKDHTLAPVVLGGLLSFWPIMNPTKEVLFLSELEEILELTRREEFHKMLEPLFLRLKQCISSQHFQVAERALFLWSNETIGGLITEVQEEILPIIYPALEKNYNEHWNEVVRNLTSNIIKMLEIMDPELLDECRREYEDNLEGIEMSRKTRDFMWERLEQDTGGHVEHNGSSDQANGISDSE